MRLWFSGPRMLDGLVRPGVSFSDRELMGSYRQKNPLRRMTDEENAFALVDGCQRRCKIASLSGAKMHQ
jgi:hypothetical protein